MIGNALAMEHMYVYVTDIASVNKTLLLSSSLFNVYVFGIRAGKIFARFCIVFCVL